MTDHSHLVSWRWLSILAALIVVGATWRAGAVVPAARADAGLIMHLEASGPAQVGRPVELTLTIRNAANVGGYETLLAYDTARAGTIGLRQREAGLSVGQRDVYPLGPITVHDGLIFGAASCPATPCANSSTQSDTQTSGVSGTIRLATVTIVPQVAGSLTFRLSDTKVVDAGGVLLPLTLAPSELTLQVADSGGPISSLPHRDEIATARVNRTHGVVGTIKPSADLTGDRRIDRADIVEATFAWKTARERGVLCASSDLSSVDIVADGCFDIADIQSVAAQVSENATRDEQPDAGLIAQDAATWIVNSADDVDEANIIVDGTCGTQTLPCTLREAIYEANVHPGPDEITFNIPGPGVHTIQLLKRLPSLSDLSGGTIIDGYTQPGAAPNTNPLNSNAQIKIEIAGQGAESFAGLGISSANNVLRGLSFYRLYRTVEISGPDARNNVIAGCFLGTNAAGTERLFTTPSAYGIQIEQAATNTLIGGTAPADRNVISGNGNDGVSLFNEGTTGTRVINNLIGLNPGGTGRVPNGGDGVDLNNGVQNTQVGGTKPGERNVISGNMFDGIEISHQTNTANNLVVGNFIGADLNGLATNLSVTGNGGWGITMEDGVSNNVITGNIIVGNGNSSYTEEVEGGIQIYGYTDVGGAVGNRITGNRIGVDANGAPAGNQGDGITLRQDTKRTLIADNVIANNGLAGVNIVNSETDYNTISRNSFYNNGGLGIDLAPQGVNENDHYAHTGPNERLNYPVITSATALGATGQACAGCVVELYLTDGSADTHGEGKTFVGSGTADAAGQFTIPMTCVGAGQSITATATDPSGNTSEFAANFTVSGSAVGSCRVWIPIVRR